MLSKAACFWGGAFFSGFAVALAALAFGDQLTECNHDGGPPYRHLQETLDVRNTTKPHSERAGRIITGAPLTCVVGAFLAA